MPRTARAIACIIIGATAMTPATEPAEHATEIVTVFPDTGGDDTCRIPSLAVTPTGTVLALAQFRRGRSDFGHRADIVLRRSTDGGRTWGTMQVLAADEESDMHNGPAVVDRERGRVLVFFRRWSAGFTGPNAYRKAVRSEPERWRAWGLGTYVIHSDDDGRNWSAPRRVEIEMPGVLTEVRCTNGTGGIQLADGRLAVLGSYDVDDGNTTLTGEALIRTMLWLSTDGGATWHAGASWDNRHDAVEQTMAQLADGRIYIAQRTTGPHRAAMILDLDSGRIVDDRLDPELPEPVCHASVLGLGGNQLAFSNPDVVNDSGRYQEDTRRKLTIRYSPDGGEHWTRSRLIDPGLAGYSSLARLDDDTLLCLYETGSERYDDCIKLARAPLAWLRSGE